MQIEWQPIETVPKDGTWFLYACPPDEEVDKWTFGVGFWCQGSPSVNWEIVDQEQELWRRKISENPRIEMSGGWTNPTHWMPLPEPPHD